MNIRKFINLVENSAKVFYHGSSDNLPVGTILRPSPTYEADWTRTDFYDVLEKYRPEGMLSHKESVFMCDNPDDLDSAGGGTEWMFTVEPASRVERHDLNWSSEISMLVSDDPENIEAIQMAAEAYWNGTPHHNDSVWEYLTPSATVIAVEEF